MAKLYSKFAIGEQFCKAVGIDPNVVTAVTFESRVGQVERATIEYYTEIGSIEIGEFELLKRSPEPPQMESFFLASTSASDSWATLCAYRAFDTRG